MYYIKFSKHFASRGVTQNKHPDKLEFMSMLIYHINKIRDHRVASFAKESSQLI